jgi:hypothetical protein
MKIFSGRKSNENNLQLKKTNMKTISKISLVTSLCLAGLGSNAQMLNSFYHIDGFPSDHALGQKVITAQATELMPSQTYVVAGVSFASSFANLPAVELSKYAQDGSNIYHINFLINTAAPANTVAVKGLVEATKASVHGYAVLAFTSAAPQQSVLIRTREDGSLLWKREVGHEQAAALAYDADMNSFLVLQRRLSGVNADLQLISIDANTGVINFTRNFDGFNKSDDEPVAIVYDAPEKSYLLIGTSTIKTIIGNEVQVMLTKTSNTGNLVYTREIGFMELAHVAVSAVLLPNGFNSQIAIGSTVSGTLNGKFYTKQPSYILVDTRTGTLADVNVIRKHFDPKGIDFLPTMSSIGIVGNEPLTPSVLGVESNLFQIDPSDPSQIGTIHIYNTAPNSIFTFADIRKGLDEANFVTVGAHKFPLPWAGSPAGLNYNWLTTSDFQGNGGCDAADSLSVFDFQVPVLSNSVSTVNFVAVAVRIEELAQTEQMIDGCGLPFRLANQTAVNSAEFRLFPNPANSAVTVEYTVAQNDNAELNLMDMTGRVISSQKLVSGDHATTSLDVANVSAGVYYSDLRVNGQSVKKDKLVVQH